MNSVVLTSSIDTMNFIDGGLSMKVTYSLPVAVSSKFGEAYKGKRVKSILAKTVVYL